MPEYHDTHHAPYSPEQVFDLVADVERYPEFLPWCKAARILERGERHFIAQLIISFKHITEQYTSRVELYPHERIEVTMLEGPFEHLSNQWEFHPEKDGTRIEFCIDFSFRYKWMDRLIGGLFTRAAEKMSTAFMEHADALYGSGD